LDNYVRLIQDYRFFYSFIRTAIYSLLNIVAINAVAFSLALVVTQKLKLKNIYRAGFFMPNLIGGLVLGYIWQFIYNRAIVQFGGVFATSILSSGNSAMIGLIIVVTWQYAGYIMMIYIAALQNVPMDLIEASKIEGANAFQRLRHILLPLVAQAFTISLFLTLVTSFKQFDTVQSLTQGFPSMLLPEWIMSVYGVTVTQTVFSLDLIASDIYKEAFTRYNMGFGQAKAIIFFVILAMISLIQVYINKRREVEM
jgi:raffinose/stachyose/melibiose transport system permease protein